MASKRILWSVRKKRSNGSAMYVWLLSTDCFVNHKRAFSFIRLPFILFFSVVESAVDQLRVIMLILSVC